MQPPPLAADKFLVAAAGKLLSAGPTTSIDAMITSESKHLLTI
jgi:hypothetical protein